MKVSATQRPVKLSAPSAAATTLAGEVLGLARPQQEAACAFLYQLGRRPVDHDWNLRAGGRLAIPTCIQFGRCGVHSQYASTVAFEALGLRERSISTAALRALGFAVPTGRERYRWVVFASPAERATYAEAHALLVTFGVDAPHPTEDESPFAPFAPDTLPEPGGRPVAACCPFHADSRPSASIYPASRLGYGAGVCHVCRGPDGAPLRFCWRRAPDGTVGARVARRQREEANDWNTGTTGRITGRYNGRPMGRPWAPSVRKLHGSTVGVGLRAVAGRSGSWVTRAGTSTLSGGVIEAIVRAERTADWGGVRPCVVDAEFETAARRERDAGRGLPPRPGIADVRDRLIRVQPQFPTATITLRSGVTIPSGWADCGVANILLDLDGLRLGGSATADEWAARVLAIVASDRRLSGRATVVRTSDGGAQVVAELARPVAGRLPAESWFADPTVRRWYAALGERLLAAAWGLGCDGGAVDWSAFSPGRLARRPGWRVTRDGSTYRARLLAACSEQRAAA